MISKQYTLGSLFLIFPLLAQALPFNIVPKTGTTLPTQLTAGQTVNAFYTVTNNTTSVRANNFVKYLPLNVTQVTSNSNIPDLCGTNFTLQPYQSTDNSCTLELLVSGAVNANDPNPKHHLVVCFPGGTTCAGTAFPLNVNVIEANNEVVAAGYYLDNAFNSYFALATSTDGGTTWSQQGLTPPDGDQGFFTGVSCTGSSCVSVGSLQQICGNTYSDVARSTDQGQTWSPQTLPAPVGYDTGILNGIYCAGQSCVAVGDYNQTATGDAISTIAVSNDIGTTWSQQVLPSPPGMNQGSLNGVTCVGNICIAAGAYQNISFDSLPGIALSPDKGVTWTQQTLTLPNGYSNGELNGVACSAISCIAVGNYFDNSGHDYLTVAISTNDGVSWSQQTLTPPGSFTQGTFQGINCTSNYCVAVGNYTYGVEYRAYPAVAVTADGGNSWSQQTLPIPTGFRYGYLNGVTCSNNTCVAVGYYESLTGVDMPFTAQSSDSGNTWTQQLLTPPVGLFIQGEFNGVG
ncbi:MAG: exo-alpha-sialidase [Legionellales bacterium]|nr:exo-alpha-sialidase [Legionellales bacterium]